MPELYRDFLDRKLTDIDNHLIDIINSLQPGPGPTPVDPIFNETLIGDNSINLANTVNLTETWRNYPIIKITLCYTNDPDTITSWYVSRSELNLIQTDGKDLRLYYDSAYRPCTFTDNAFTQRLTSTFTIKYIHGIDCTNYTITESVIFNNPLDSGTTDITNINPFEYDLIFITSSINTTNVMNSRSIIMPCTESYFSNNIWYFIGYNFGYSANIYLTNNSMSIANYKYVIGLKLT